MNTEPVPEASTAKPAIKPKKNKLAVGIGMLVATTAIIAAAIFLLGPRQPPVSAVREFVAASLKGQPVSIVKFDRSYKGDGESGQVLFAGEVELTQPIYVRADAASYLQSEFGVSLPALQADLALLKSPRLAARLQELIGPAPGGTDRVVTNAATSGAALSDVVLVKQPVRVGTRLRLSGSLRATRIGSLWQFDPVAMQLTPNVPAGEHRPSGDAVYDVSDLKEQSRLRQLVEAHVAYAAKLKALRPKLEAEIQQERQDRLASFAQLMRPGSLFLGIAVGSQNDSYKIILETTQCSAKANTVSAFLRNDGGWSDARGFVGEWSLDPDGEHCHLTLQTHATERIEGAGPLLDASDTWMIDGALSAGGTFEAKSLHWQFHLQRVTEAEQAQVRATLSEPLMRALAATSPKSLYHGVVLSKRTHNSEQVLLRFEEQESGGSLVTATLSLAAHESWKRPLRGTIVASRFRAGDSPVRLRSEPIDKLDSADRESVLGFSDRLAVAFRVDGEQLLGEDDHFSFRLERADAAWLAKYTATQADRSARLLKILKAGNAYDGIARDDRGMVSRLRLRILEVDPHDALLTVSFDSREQYGVYHRMSGSFDATTGAIQLGSSGVAKADSTGVLRVPLFTGTSSQRVSLQLDGDALNGRVENQGWSLTLAVAAAPTIAAEAELPTTAGAYALVDGRWQPMPRNNGHTVFAAPQVLGGVLNALHAIDSRIPAQQAPETSDQAGTLIYDGNAAAPAANRESVVIVYVGDVAPPSVALRQKYSELRDYPAIEMARLQPTRDGKRQAPLLKIVPGVTGFGSTRVAAALEQPRANATLLRCTGPLDPGDYAVLIGSAAFEVEVR